jgi:hypothetical protein
MDLERVRQEVEALRLVAPLLAEGKRSGEAFTRTGGVPRTEEHVLDVVPRDERCDIVRRRKL